MILATNYQKFSKFVKVTAKILSVPFLLGHGVFGSVKNEGDQSVDLFYESEQSLWNFNLRFRLL